MKTLNTLISENNEKQPINEQVEQPISEKQIEQPISEKQIEQPINEGFLLLAGLFGALALGLGAIFSATKDDWDDEDEPTDEQKAESHSIFKKLSDSAKAAFNNAIDKVSKHDEEVPEEQKSRLEQIEDLVYEGKYKEALELIKEGIKDMNTDEGMDRIDSAFIPMKFYTLLKKCADELDDEDAKKLAKELKDRIDNKFGKEGAEKAKDEIVLEDKIKVHLAKIVSNAQTAYSDGGDAFKSFKSLLDDAAKIAKDKLDSEDEESGDDEQGSDVTEQAMIDYVIHVAYGMGPKHDLFPRLIGDDLTFVSALEVLIAATMIINASKYKKEQLETYQNMFNTLGLQIKLKK